MTIRVGYIPYLNMEPFHQGFGPEPLEAGGHRFEFLPMSPRRLGLKADKGEVDAGAMSLVDYRRVWRPYVPGSTYVLGVKREALSVLVFSRKPLASLEGV